MPFWRRKKDEFVSLGLSRAASQRASETQTETKTEIEKQPAPVPVSDKPSTQPSSSSPWQTSVLGLNLSVEQLQAQEAALEQELSARFRRAVAGTRESLSERIDTVFAGAKRIDAELLDELEEALIAAYIRVPAAMHGLETVRPGSSREAIRDIEKVKNT